MNELAKKNYSSLVHELLIICVVGILTCVDGVGVLYVMNWLRRLSTISPPFVFTDYDESLSIHLVVIPWLLTLTSLVLFYTEWDFGCVGIVMTCT